MPDRTPSAASSRDQLELAPQPHCEYCGPLGWTEERFGRLTHKCGCPHRIHTYCQAHPTVCDEFTDIRNEAWRKSFSSQLTELPGTEFEDIFGGAA